MILLGNKQQAQVRLACSAESLSISKAIILLIAGMCISELLALPIRKTKTKQDCYQILHNCVLQL